MQYFRLLAAIALLFPSLFADWPEFRGPTGQGLSEAKNLPLSWSESENVIWKTAIPGSGWSSPVVLDGRIWLTTATDQGRSLRAVAVQASSGKILHDVEVFRLESSPAIHEKNTHASPTAILEPDRVYVHFGAQGTAALDGEGNVLWRNQELGYQHGHGTGGSPAIWRDLLIINCDGVDRQFIAALDKTSGRVRWTRSRGTARMAFSTPLVIETDDGPQVVTTTGDQAVAYRPADGEELWRIAYDGFSLVPRPVYAHGLVYLTTGFYGPMLIAARPDGRGDAGGEQIAWRTNRAVPLTSSPIVVDDLLFMVSDNGIASALEAATGAPIWQQRLPGGYSASPLAANGRIYFSNEEGVTTVIAAGRQFRVLADNAVAGRLLASLGVDGEALLLRTDTHLYRIGK